MERLASGHLTDVHAKLADLRRLEKVLAELVARCKGGTVPECPILEALFDLPETPRQAKRRSRGRAAR